MRIGAAAARLADLAVCEWYQRIAIPQAEPMPSSIHSPGVAQCPEALMSRVDERRVGDTVFCQNVPARTVNS